MPPNMTGRGLIFHFADNNIHNTKTFELSAARVRA
jgi:hypothetical protein